jgi:hypothetical protein
MEDGFGETDSEAVVEEGTTNEDHQGRYGWKIALERPTVRRSWRGRGDQQGEEPQWFGESSWM